MRYNWHTRFLASGGRLKRFLETVVETYSMSMRYSSSCTKHVFVYRKFCDRILRWPSSDVKARVFLSFPWMCDFRNGRNRKRLSPGLVMRDLFSTAEGKNGQPGPPSILLSSPRGVRVLFYYYMLGSKGEVLKLALHRLK